MLEIDTNSYGLAPTRNCRGPFVPIEVVPITESWLIHPDGTAELGASPVLEVKQEDDSVTIRRSLGSSSPDFVCRNNGINASIDYVIERSEG